MIHLLPLAERVGRILKLRQETLAIAESSAGGLINAAMLAVPGASAYCIGGVVVYTYGARKALLGIGEEQMAGLRPSTEAYALLLARQIRERCGASWGLSETGATGPAGNRYGDAPGHACIAIAGSASERAMTLETGHGVRQDNMRQFAACALELLETHLAELGPAKN
jgi:nicotinamide-nucleotide amidase